MSKDKLTDYDATASNNTDVGGISVAEGMLPSGVNNAIREQMSHQKEAFGLGTPLYVDQTNNRLGVGTTSPTRNISISDTAPYINLVGSTTSAIGMLLGDTDAEIRGALLYDNNADRINLRAGGNTTRVSIDSDGLKFGSDTAAANALDDYEEGTWTPASGTITLSSSVGKYTKVGNMVFIIWQIEFPSTSDGNSAIVGGLPFNVGSGQYSGTTGITNFGSSNILPMVNYADNTVTFRTYSNTTYTNANMSLKFHYGWAVYTT